MSARRVAVFLLGLWIGCTLFMGWVAIHNLDSVDTVLKQPNRQLQREIKDFGYDRVKTLARFQAAELNRHYFYNWEWLQILLLVVTAAVLLFATNGNGFTMVLALVVFLLLLVQHFLVGPQVVELSKGFDFATPDQFLDERRAFQTYHTYYSWIEVIKMGLLVLITVRMLLHGSSGRRRRRHRRVEVDAVDDADHSHVNG